MDTPTIVVCLGNELAGDDGIGFRVGRVIKALGPLPGVELIFRAEVGLDLLDLMPGAGRLVLVDAACSGQPAGNVRSIGLSELERLDGQPAGCHGLGLGQLLRAGQALGRSGQALRVAVVAIEIERVEHFSTALSPPVRAALPEAVARVLAAVGAGPDLIARGRKLAHQRLDFDPGPADVP